MKTKLKRLVGLAIFVSYSFIGNAQIPEEFHKFLAKTDTTNLYWKVDENPQFKGGHESLVNYYKDNFVYPEESQKKGIQGTVFVLFIVEKDGSISNVYATNSIDKYLEKEAVKFIKKMPNWEPGKKDGKTVRVLNVQPVKFALQ
nr:energy transducer TonB [uncultured Carboxylicivirga sp.]